MRGAGTGSKGYHTGGERHCRQVLTSGKGHEHRSTIAVWVKGRVRGKVKAKLRVGVRVRVRLG